MKCVTSAATCVSGVPPCGQTHTLEMELWRLMRAGGAYLCSTNYDICQNAADGCFSI